MWLARWLPFVWELIDVRVTTALLGIFAAFRGPVVLVRGTLQQQYFLHIFDIYIYI